MRACGPGQYPLRVQSHTSHHYTRDTRVRSSTAACRTRTLRWAGREKGGRVAGTPTPGIYRPSTAWGVSGKRLREYFNTLYPKELRLILPWSSLQRNRTISDV